MYTETLLPDSAKTARSMDSGQVDQTHQIAEAGEEAIPIEDKSPETSGQTDADILSTETKTTSTEESTSSDSEEESSEWDSADGTTAATISKSDGVNDSEVMEEKTTSFQVNHDVFDQLLKKYVDVQGGVNYKGFSRDIEKLNSYITHLEANGPETSWPRGRQMAYWINAYNALTIQMIVANYPVSSITKLHNGKPWDVAVFRVNGDDKSLNDIEHNILRPEFQDARIHFAVNCAAKSCPKIHNEAWTADNLESNLEKMTKAFINNTRANKISSSSLELSKIFEWYGEDFEDLVGFIARYSEKRIKSNAKISFKEYDWSLNEI